jgi:tetratricopeptide (TPR) repeat protein
MNLRYDLAQSQQLAEESLTLCRAAGDEQGESLALLILARTFGYRRFSMARPMYERCLALGRARSDHIRIGEALHWMAHNLAYWSALHPIELVEQAQAIFRIQGHWVGLSMTLNEQAKLAIWKGDYTLARRNLNECLTLTQRSAALAGLSAYAMDPLGRLALREGDFARARLELEASTRLLQDVGQNMRYYWSLVFLGRVALCQGGSQHAYSIFKQSLQHFHEANIHSGMVFTIEGLASLAMLQGQPARAAKLLAWADVTRAATSDPRPPVEQADVDRDLAVIHTQLDDATFEAEQAIGRAMTMDEAIAYALSEEVVN